MFFPTKYDKGNHFGNAALKGATYRGYGWMSKTGSKHCGVDINIEEGQDVYAVDDGRIIFCGLKEGFGSLNPSSKGYVIILLTIDGYWIYGHVNPEIKLNEIVKAGQKLGTIAKFYNEGIFLPHLHFCLWTGNEYNLLNNTFWGYVKDLKNWQDPIEFLKLNNAKII